MRQISLEELEQKRDDFDAMVQSSPEIDQYCSSSHWVISAYYAFSDDDPIIFELDDGFLAMQSVYSYRFGRLLMPLENSWLMAAPIVGAHPLRVAKQARLALDTVKKEYEGIFLPGYPFEKEWFYAFIEAFRSGHSIRVGNETKRIRASLEGGVAGWKKRRKHSFRRNLSNMQNRCHKAGIEFEYHRHCTDWESLWRRILTVERRCWKGLSGSGIHQGSMKTFYTRMLPGLAARDMLRIGFARKDDQDLAYIFGGVFGETYRGLQLSFEQGNESLSLGNFMQYNKIVRLVDEGVETYDLGQDMAYKYKWAETAKSTKALLIT